MQHAVRATWNLSKSTALNRSRSDLSNGISAGPVSPAVLQYFMRGWDGLGLRRQAPPPSNPAPPGQIPSPRRPRTRWPLFVLQQLYVRHIARRRGSAWPSSQPHGTRPCDVTRCVAVTSCDQASLTQTGPPLDATARCSMRT